jgi:hypothetical protein
MSSEEFESLDPISPPAGKGKLTNQQILLGQKLDPLNVIKTYSEDEWEQFIREWVESLRDRYTEVRKASGAGDKGRDVIGYVQSVNSSGPWDNYQCKHYDHPLYPGDMWKELAKLCYYTFIKRFSIPRQYFFVAPRGVGPEGLNLLENPKQMREGLIAQGMKGDLLKVGGRAVLLSGELLKYVEGFDFGIVKDVPPSKVIDEHHDTRYYAPRFGGGLVRLPPDKADVPANIADIEARFVEQLLEAYGDQSAKTFSNAEELGSHPNFKRHFDRQRNYFYLAELLRNFTRDNIPEDGCFERLQDLIYDGVIDTVENDYANGFERLKETVKAARQLQIDSHPLRECLEGYHRSGVCHQLANDNRVKWVP